MRGEELHDGEENSQRAAQEKTFGEDERKKGHYVRREPTPEFSPLKTTVRGAEWTLDRSAG